MNGSLLSRPSRTTSGPKCSELRWWLARIQAGCTRWL